MIVCKVINSKKERRMKRLTILIMLLAIVIAPMYAGGSIINQHDAPIQFLSIYLTSENINPH